MKKILSSILLPLTLVGMVGVGAASAASEFPIEHPKELDWSFAGPFGHYDQGQLQRGLKVYVEVCAACHSMDLVAFRSLEDLGYSKEQVKSFAAEYKEVPGEPNADGDVEDRPAKPTDFFGSPYENVEQAAAANNGAAPPDFSLIAKARYVERGFPQFVFDIFTGYNEAGPNYIYSLLTGYEDAPADVGVAEGTHYNPYFMSGSSLAMAAPISDEQVSYDDGSPETLDQYSKDVSAFLMWAAEPHLGERKRIGFMVISFMLLLTILVYLTKKSVYSRIKH
ncbi:cytochrome c1 [Lentilitoribacter sp. EG35]|uniref:cytochrome c1 n=1 Tax=Lentilitoribacter sp. EG35 TaxID=3234192 RepID=UPI0034615C41